MRAPPSNKILSDLEVYFYDSDSNEDIAYIKAAVSYRAKIAPIINFVLNSDTYVINKYSNFTFYIITNNTINSTSYIQIDIPSQFTLTNI